VDGPDFDFDESQGDFKPWVTWLGLTLSAIVLGAWIWSILNWQTLRNL
jgi:hypothetical protein